MSTSPGVAATRHEGRVGDHASSDSVSPVAVVRPTYGHVLIAHSEPEGEGLVPRGLTPGPVVDEFQGGSHGPHPVVLVGDRDPEQCRDVVFGELVNDTPVVLDDALDPCPEPGQLHLDLARIRTLEKAIHAGNDTRKHRDGSTLATRREPGPGRNSAEVLGILQQALDIRQKAGGIGW